LELVGSKLDLRKVQNPHIDGNAMWAVRNCFLSIFVITSHIWKMYHPSDTCV